MKILISTTTFAQYDPEPLRLLRRARLDYVCNPLGRRPTSEEMISWLSKDRYIGLLAGTEILSREVLEHSKTLAVISRVGTGVDNIDHDAAKRLGIKLCNTPGILTDAVAELTIGLILACLRHISIVDRDMHQGQWQKKMGYLLKGKTVGIVGFGAIGRRVAVLTKAFGAHPLAYDIRVERSAGVCPLVSWREILKKSDILSFHVSSNERLIAADELGKLKKGVILINTSRGQVVDEEALYTGLKSGRIAQAALDVHHPEPYQGKLQELNNIILTPHIGSYAKEARVQMEIKAVENLIKGLRQKSLQKRNQIV